MLALERDLTLPPETGITYSNRMATIEARAKKLLPGTASGIHTLLVNGKLITDKELIDLELAKYWKKFSRNRPPRLVPGRL